TYPSPSLYPSLGSDVFDPLWIAVGDLVLGAVDVTGVRFTVDKFDGWGSPASSATLTQRARGHGATSSEGFLHPRVMTIEGLIMAPVPGMLSTAADSLSLAVALSQFPMLVSEQGRIRNATAQRQDDVQVTYLSDITARYSIQIVAKDPRKFGDLVTATTRLPFSEDGATWPITLPLTFTGVSGTGVVRVNNPGNTQAPVWLRIDGPIPAGGWTITHQGKQQSLTFATALELGAGEFVTVDMDRREVLAQGQAPRSGYVTSRGWFSLDPGDNDIAFSSQNYSSTASLTVTTKPSWS
ncbi:MAG: phage tail family protein, partial [Actinomycetota bacterium]|nr:phage tail family protein [Actinomycetota bacterium]